MPEIERVTTMSGPTAEGFTRIYETSFPASERDDVEALLASVAAGMRDCYLAVEDGEVLGLGVLLRLQLPGVRFLEYLAVDPDHRSRGVGGLLLDRLRAESAGDESAGAGGPGIVFEVEHPDHGADGERDLRVRRVDFYRRHGAAVLDGVPCFRAPRLDGEGTVPYRLMWLPAAGAASQLDGAFLRHTVEAILVESYGLPPEDPIVTAALDDLTG